MPIGIDRRRVEVGFINAPSEYTHTLAPRESIEACRFRIPNNSWQLSEFRQKLAWKNWDVSLFRCGPACPPTHRVLPFNHTRLVSKIWSSEISIELRKSKQAKNKPVLPGQTAYVCVCVWERERERESKKEGMSQINVSSVASSSTPSSTVKPNGEAIPGVGCCLPFFTACVVRKVSNLKSIDTSYCRMLGTFGFASFWISKCVV